MPPHITVFEAESQHGPFVPPVANYRWYHEIRVIATSEAGPTGLCVGSAEVKHQTLRECEGAAVAVGEAVPIFGGGLPVLGVVITDFILV